MNNEDTFRKATAIIILACESGYETVKAVFNDKKVIKTVKTIGAGNYTLSGRTILTTPFEWTGLELSVHGYPLDKVAEKLGLHSTFFDAGKEPKQKMVNITINGKCYQAEEGANLLEALLSSGFKIPHLCHKPELSSAGTCRLCLVKIKGRKGLVPSCCTQVEEGMEITAEDDELNDLRKLILEMVLAEHEYDSLLSRRSELRIWIRRFGIDKACFQLPRETEPIDDSSEVFIRDPNYCILCGRCVRACAEISCQKILDFAYRGSKTYVIAGLNEPIGQTNCVACMACINSCPTGAMTPKLIHNY